MLFTRKGSGGYVTHMGEEEMLAEFKRNNL
jgi:hypothetical protein